jgi:hypothetical protein
MMAADYKQYRLPTVKKNIPNIAADGLVIITMTYPVEIVDKGKQEQENNIEAYAEKLRAVLPNDFDVGVDKDEKNPSGSRIFVTNLLDHEYDGETFYAHILKMNNRDIAKSEELTAGCIDLLGNQYLVKSRQIENLFSRDRDTFEKIVSESTRITDIRQHNIVHKDILSSEARDKFESFGVAIRLQDMDAIDKVLSSDKKMLTNKVDQAIYDNLTTIKQQRDLTKEDILPYKMSYLAKHAPNDANISPYIKSCSNENFYNSIEVLAGNRELATGILLLYRVDSLMDQGKNKEAFVTIDNVKTNLFYAQDDPLRDKLDASLQKMIDNKLNATPLDSLRGGIIKEMIITPNNAKGAFQTVHATLKEIRTTRNLKNETLDNICTIQDYSHSRLDSVVEYSKKEKSFFAKDKLGIIFDRYHDTIIKDPNSISLDVHSDLITASLKIENNPEKYKEKQGYTFQKMFGEGEAIGKVWDKYLADIKYSAYDVTREQHEAVVKATLEIELNPLKYPHQQQYCFSKVFDKNTFCIGYKNVCEYVLPTIKEIEEQVCRSKNLKVENSLSDEKSTNSVDEKSTTISTSYLGISTATKITENVKEITSEIISLGQYSTLDTPRSESSKISSSEEKLEISSRTARTTSEDKTPSTSSQDSSKLDQQSCSTPPTPKSTVSENKSFDSEWSLGIIGDIVVPIMTRMDAVIPQDIKPPITRAQSQKVNRSSKETDGLNRSQSFTSGKGGIPAR